MRLGVGIDVEFDMEIGDELTKADPHKLRDRLEKDLKALSYIKDLEIGPIVMIHGEKTGPRGV
jgi:hypothetical protein